MAYLVKKLAPIVYDDALNPVRIHYETDVDCVIMPDGKNTLATFLVNFTGSRTIAISGGATGTVSYKPIDEGTVELEVEVTDDGHKHSGSTVVMPEPNRVLVSGADRRTGVSAVTATELGMLSGVTENVQTQLDGKSATGHSHDDVYVRKDQLGKSGGVATLGTDGKISEEFLPATANVQVSETAPTDQKEGDMWFEPIT